MEKPKCLNCGKEMEAVYDEIAEKITGYQWHCECMPEGVNVSIGNATMN